MLQDLWKETIVHTLRDMKNSCIILKRETLFSDKINMMMMVSFSLKLTYIN